MVDMTVRIGAACVMTAAGAWGGRMLAGAQMRRTQTLEALRSGVRRLEAEMLERRMPLADALEMSGDRLFEATAEEMRAGEAPFEAYERAAERLRVRGGALDSLEEGDMAALSRLFEHLGDGSVQSQRLLLRDAEEELGRLAIQARNRRQEYGKLYTSLGALGGGALALLLM